jgi:hypothetical protein
MERRARLSYSAVWEDAAALLRAHGSLLAALAGVFLFLPALVLRQFAVVPTLEGAPADIAHLVAVTRAYVIANWPLILPVRLLELVGGVAMLELMLGPRGTSVAGAIRTGFLLLPFYFVTFVLANFALAVGVALLILPGVYLLGRLGPFPAVLVAERRRNPLDVFARAFALTAGRGWALAVLLLLVLFAALVVGLVAGDVAGVVATLIAGREVGAFMAGAASAAAGAAGEVVMLALFAALYRALSPSAPT